MAQGSRFAVLYPNIQGIQDFNFGYYIWQLVVPQLDTPKILNGVDFTSMQYLDNMFDKTALVSTTFLSLH